MKILVIHNRYQQPGGENVIFHAETTLLRQHGHKVMEYTEDSERINRMNRLTVAV